MKLIFFSLFAALATVAVSSNQVAASELEIIVYDGHKLEQEARTRTSLRLLDEQQKAAKLQLWKENGVGCTKVSTYGTLFISGSDRWLYCTDQERQQYERNLQRHLADTKRNAEKRKKVVAANFKCKRVTQGSGKAGVRKAVDKCWPKGEKKPGIFGKYTYIPGWLAENGYYNLLTAEEKHKREKKLKK